jgi:hypothetical protein
VWRAGIAPACISHHASGPPGSCDSRACRSPVTQTQLFGYSLAFLGVCVYNYRKVQSMKQAAVGASKAPDKPGAQETLLADRDAQQPLLTERRSSGTA